MTDAPLEAFTISDVGKRAGIGRTLIYSEIAAGRLRARKVGRRTVILSADLAAWLKALPALRTTAA
jgi:excisionase family DNA binding protein